ncbi:peptidase M48 Ste24p [Haloterrigena turkmenica DSM 5511]|uniref:Peptidase M48 Ste24p n=1 Tax=Haloterrigena turkmenica (strain ATCC 51198 / DSM 5511 / JCM 9101 / NCIMB 13204 / VKM B-1734 / 4k) TaxID=543526 RepID=D2RX79_HALTV|nr:M48 family metalloprotease [Haloterrigena turkmenica]ADB59691.1 peptidase M48 Ste24p [Haloterrigena turkmenica DSM 5511]
MTDFGLKLRMVVVGAILFAFYVGAATFLALLFGVSPLLILPAGIVILPAIQYKLGKWMALRGAEEMPEDGQYREVHQMTESLSRDMGVDKPKLMVMSMGVPNAFAVGRKGAGVVCVSTELMQILERDELEGVIAHEIAHIKNRDVITMVVGQSIGMMVGYVAYFAVLMGGERNIGTWILAMVASSLANMLVMVFVLAISRYREYVADEDARQYIGTGEPLARALEKISSGAQGRESKLDDSMSALCIMNTDRGLMEKLFASHPPTEKRIEKLRS